MWHRSPCRIFFFVNMLIRFWRYASSMSQQLGSRYKDLRSTQAFFRSITIEHMYYIMFHRVSFLVGTNWVCGYVLLSLHLLLLMRVPFQVFIWWEHVSKAYLLPYILSIEGECYISTSLMKSEGYNRLQCHTVFFKGDLHRGFIPLSPLLWYIHGFHECPRPRLLDGGQDEAHDSTKIQLSDSLGYRSSVCPLLFKTCWKIINYFPRGIYHPLSLGRH